VQINRLSSLTYIGTYAVLWSATHKDEFATLSITFNMTGGTLLFTDGVLLNKKLKHWRSGWPDWANFRLLGGCLLRTALWKWQIVGQIFRLFFKWYKSCIKSDRKMFGDTFYLGDFFHKLIWSPCSRSAGRPRSKTRRMTFVVSCSESQVQLMAL
jgi:hypothetical protein